MAEPNGAVLAGDEADITALAAVSKGVTVDGQSGRVGTEKQTRPQV